METLKARLIRLNEESIEWNNYILESDKFSDYQKAMARKTLPGLFEDQEKYNREEY